MEIAAYLRTIGRYWWLILLTTLVSTGLAFGVTMVKAKSYTTHARVLAQASSVITDARSLADIAGQVGMRSVMGTFAQYFSATGVKTAARAAMGFDEQTAANYPVEANVLPDTSVIEVTGKGPDPVVLTNYVNATVDAAVKGGGSLYKVIELQTLERASVPQAPSSPQPSRDIPVGAGLGLALGLLLAFAIEYMRTPRRTENEGEVAIRTLPITPLPIMPIQRDDRMIGNGRQTQGQQRQAQLPEYTGRQQRSGPGEGSGNALPPGWRDDAFPG